MTPRRLCRASPKSWPTEQRSSVEPNELEEVRMVESGKNCLTLGELER